MTLLLALSCFAANSLLCRWALQDGAIDPVSFTTIRIASGAFVLAALAPVGRGSFRSSFLLLGYALLFAVAYQYLTASTGAMLLFAAVQTTMLTAAVRRGERLRAPQKVGLFFALGGVIWLLAPGLSAPPPAAALAMILSGVCWGGYSLRGRESDGSALAATAHHFVLALPFAVLVSLARLPALHVTSEGVWLAIASGAVTSGLGYALWSRALRSLSATSAATAQLLVPVLTAAAGVAWLGESPSLRFLLASALVLTGVALTLPSPLRRRVEWPHGLARRRRRARGGSGARGRGVLARAVSSRSGDDRLRVG